jgi:hypothetical protein
VPGTSLGGEERCAASQTTDVVVDINSYHDFPWIHRCIEAAYFRYRGTAQQRCARCLRARPRSAETPSPRGQVIDLAGASTGNRRRYRVGLANGRRPVRLTDTSPCTRAVPVQTRRRELRPGQAVASAVIARLNHRNGLLLQPESHPIWFVSAVGSPASPAEEQLEWIRC